MNATIRNLLIFSLLLIFASDGTPLSAQGPVRKTVRDVHQTKLDYRLEKPYYYQPSDPWTRSKTFRRHTGHWGLFYNCDGEECKRNSPYICWKCNHEPDLPARKGFFRCLKDDLDEVKKRIRNGACCPDDIVQGAPCATGTCGSCALCNSLEANDANAAVVDSSVRILQSQRVGKQGNQITGRFGQQQQSGHQIDPLTGQCNCKTCQARLAKERKLLR